MEALEKGVKYVIHDLLVFVLLTLDMFHIFF